MADMAAFSIDEHEEKACPQISQVTQINALKQISIF